MQGKTGGDEAVPPRPPGILIRPALGGDAAGLALAACAGVIETYAALLDGDDIVAFCHEHHTASAYATWIADPDCWIWVACTATGTIVGYLLLSPATLPDDKPGADDLEIRRIYVLGPFHGTGTGRALMQAALDEAARRRAPRVVLGVLGVNRRALDFYERCGFEQIGTRTFQVGRTLCDDRVLALAAPFTSD